MRNFFEDFLSFLKTFIFALLIVIPIRYFLFQPFVVNGASMEPNFKAGEYLLVDELSYRFRELRRGEVVVFKYPKDPSFYYIKRVIALPGETIEIQDNKVRIYNFEYPEGKVLNEPYIKGETKGEIKLVLGKDEYFLMGDNREYSSDSRVFGPVERKYIIGRAWIGISASNGFQLIRGFSY